MTNDPMQTGFLPPLARDTLAQQVYQVIVRYILRTGAEVGSRLPSERRFSEMLEVSRTVVRDAFDQLAQEGFVEKRIGAGVILVQRPPAFKVETGLTLDSVQATLQDLYQARIALEVGAIEWIVQGLTEQALDNLARLVDEMQTRILAGAPILKEDREFHHTLIQACSNPVIIQFAAVIDQYFEQMRRYHPELAIDGSRLDLLDVRHRMVVMALRTRDTEAARQALRLHFLPLPQAPKPMI
jgi:GntR family transcriptional regulator, transcriptional repressor for pyruvate dehydrogenase complex